MTDTLEDNQYNYVNIMLSRNLLNKKTNIYLLEAMSETQPLFLNQNFKAPNGAVVPVQHEHGQRGELSRAVPAVATVHHYRRLPRLHFVRNPQSSC